MTEQEFFNAYFTYESTGTLINNKTGKIAGGYTDEGYIRIRINSKEYRAHRIVWIMFNGSIPDNLLVDHINGLRDDNRIENLRLATRAQNNANREVQQGRKYKLPKGVTLDSGKYRAKIYYNGTIMCLGTYNTPEEASVEYNKMAEKLHGAFANHVSKGKV